MVRDFYWWSDAQNPSVSLVEQREEHFLVELFRIGQSGALEELDDVVVIYVILGVKLG